MRTSAKTEFLSLIFSLSHAKCRLKKELFHHFLLTHVTLSLLFRTWHNFIPYCLSATDMLKCLQFYTQLFAQTFDYLFPLRISQNISYAATITKYFSHRTIYLLLNPTFTHNPFVRDNVLVYVHFLLCACAVFVHVPYRKNELFDTQCVDVAPEWITVNNCFYTWALALSLLQKVSSSAWFLSATVKVWLVPLQ